MNDRVVHLFVTLYLTMGHLGMPMVRVSAHFLPRTRYGLLDARPNNSETKTTFSAQIRKIPTVSGFWEKTKSTKFFSDWCAPL